MTFLDAWKICRKEMGVPDEAIELSIKFGSAMVPDAEINSEITKGKEREVVEYLKRLYDSGHFEKICQNILKNN